MDWARYADQLVQQHRLPMIPQGMSSPQFMPQSRPVSPFGQAYGGQGGLSAYDAKLLGMQVPGQKKKREGLNQWLPTIGAIGAGLLAAPLTGGASLPAAIAISAGAGALGGGLGELGAQALNDEKADFGAVGNEALMSAIFGGVGGGVGSMLGKGAKAGATAISNADDAGNIITRSGQNLQRAAVKPTVKASPFGASSEKQIIDFANKYLPAGSSARKYQALPEFMGKTSSQIDDILKVNTATISKSQLTNGIKSSLKSDIRFANGEPQFENALKQILGTFKGSGTGGKLTASDIFKVKQQLGNKLSSAFGKEGANLLPAQNTGIAVWEQLDDYITKLAPEAKELTILQSTAFKSAPGLLKGQNARPLNIFGTPVPGAARTIQSASDRAGRALTSLGGGKVGQTLAKPGVAPTLSQAVGHALTQPPQEAQQPTEDTTMANPMLDMTTEPEIDETALMTQQAKMDLSNKYSQAMMEDLQVTGGKNISKLKTMYDMEKDAFAGMEDMNKASGGGDPKDITKIKKAQALVNELFNVYQNAGGAQGRVGGGLASAMGVVGANPGVNAYNQVKQGYISQIIRAMGEVGTLTDKDREVINSAIPSIWDTSEEAKIKMNLINRVLQNSLAITKSSPQSSSKSRPSTLDEAIYQTQEEYY